MIIKGAEGMSPENIRDEVHRGGRLVVYTYCVSIIVLTFKRSAGLRLVRAGHSPAAAGWPWTLVSALFGWWGIPWGPIYTIECIYKNLCGGIDVTDELLPQLLPAGAGAARTPRPAEPPTLTVAPAPARRFDLRVAGLMAAAACLVILLGLSALCFHRQQNLTVVLASGLDRPYTVLLNGESRLLRPFAAEVLTLAEGDFVLADAPGSRVVGDEQRFRLALPFFDHLHSERVAIINPDRVAVFARGEVPYYSDGTKPPADEPPVFTLLAGQLTHFLARPDFVLVDADTRISMPTGATRVVKTRLSHIKDPDLSSLVRTLHEKSGYPAARDYLMLLARHRTDETILGAAVQALETADLRPFFQLHLGDRPVLMEWHRYYQQQMIDRRTGHDLVAEYRAWLAAEPGNGDLIYLLGRQLDDQAEQTRMWHAALAATPPCPYAHGALGFDALSMGRFADADTHYRTAREAGVTSGGLDHYRRLTCLALGRSDLLLAELAELRKSDPLNIGLAAQEMQAGYALSRNREAIAHVKEAYLAAYRKTKPSEKNYADADVYLLAEIAHLTGDLPAYARLLARFESPFYRFRAALAAGRLDDAAKATNETDTNAQLLLYLLAVRAGDNAAAERHFAAAHTAMRNDDPDYRKVADQLDRGRPDPQVVCGLHMNLESKRILLTALGTRLTGDRNTYFDLARKLNFSPEFPHQFLRTFLFD